MGQQNINTGSVANDGSGDPIRIAFDKANLNFAELYSGKLEAINISQNLSSTGSANAGGSFNFNLISSIDNVVGGATPTVTFGVYNTVHSAATGSHITLEAVANVTQAQSIVPPGMSVVATWPLAQASVNMGGSDNGTNASGKLFASNPQVVARAGATFLAEIVGVEIDVSCLTGASTKNKIGLNVTTLGSDAVAGSSIDAAVVIGSVAGSPKWSDAFLLSSYNGASPINSAGSVMRADIASSCANGIDLSNFTFSGYAFKSYGFSVDGVGKVSGDLSGFTVTADGAIKPHG